MRFICKILYGTMLIGIVFSWTLLMITCQLFYFVSCLWLNGYIHNGCKLLINVNMCALLIWVDVCVFVSVCMPVSARMQPCTRSMAARLVPRWHEGMASGCRGIVGLPVSCGIWGSVPHDPSGQDTAIVLLLYVMYVFCMFNKYGNKKKCSR